MIKEWDKYFNNTKNVKVVHGDIFEVDTDAIVTPGNSYGIMDAGLDSLIVKYFGKKIEEKIQNKIKKEYNGLLLVGQSIMIETGNENIPYVIYTPTMISPRKIHDTINVYLSMRGILTLIKSLDNELIISIPALGTGYGGLDPTLCAKQMRFAYEDDKNNYFPNNIMEAITKRRKLLRK